MATRCPDCGHDVVEELDYCFGCFRHLESKPTEPAKGRKASKKTIENASDAGYIPDGELVDTASTQSVMTWEPGSIPKGTLTFGLAIQDSEWGSPAREDL